jgi:hypothetical protein
MRTSVNNRKRQAAQRAAERMADRIMADFDWSYNRRPDEEQVKEWLVIAILRAKKTGFRVGHATAVKQWLRGKP